MSFFRDFFRRRRVRRHVARHGWVFDFHGQKVELPELDHPGFASALLRGKYEAEEAELIRLYLRPEQPVIELGGSFGVVSRLISSRLAPDVRHIVVEANPHLIEICTRNALGNGAGRTEVVNAAIFYGGPEAAFNVTGDLHASRLAKNGDAKTVKVPAVTLASLWQKIGSPDAYTLISDIEGGEFELVANEPQILARAGTVIMEVHPKLYPGGEADANALFARMESVGFTPRERYGDVCVWTKE